MPKELHDFKDYILIFAESAPNKNDQSTLPNVNKKVISWTTHGNK